MQTDHGDGYSGQQLASEAVTQLVQRAGDYCECEKQRIEVANQPKILALRAEMSLLIERARDLKERVRLAPPPGDLRSRRRSSRYYWAVALFLCVAGFFFSLLAFDPYRLGWKSYLYCVGIAVVCPFCVDKFLAACGTPRLVKSLATIACVAALTGLVLLAVIRGDVLAQYLQTASPVVILGDEGAAATGAQNNFFDSTVPLLKLFMALLALAMELGAGLALHDARKLALESGEDYAQVSRELATVQQQMVEQVHAISTLQNEAAAFVSRFWRDFHRAMLNGAVQSALKRLSLILLCLLLLGPVLAHAGEHLHIVGALDLSKSEAVKGNDNKAEFEKHLAAVSRLLAGLPAGARVTIIGITENSFALPYILLDAKLDEDEGYFQERLAAARRQVMSAWKQRCAKLRPEFSHTDEFGALLVASELFKQTPQARHVLVIFSDMRQETSLVDLETPTAISVDRSLTKVAQHRLLADLQGVEIYALGVDSAGKTITYWNSLRNFWVEYFRGAGANLKSYSILRDPPDAATLR